MPSGLLGCCRMNAQSKVDSASPCLQGTALRVKYRLMDVDGKPIKQIVGIQSSGVHRRNRGGVYPNGQRCKELCRQVLTDGFIQAEFEHQLVVVEEPSSHDAIQLAKTTPLDQWESSEGFNVANCDKDHLLSSCFQPPNTRVNYNWLSHNHMMMVMRAFIVRAKWDMSPRTLQTRTGEEFTVTFCDDNGLLSLQHLAEAPTAQGFLEVIKFGANAEVLSHKMDIEEPAAAGIISAALNVPQARSMKATEIAAVNALQGAFIKEQAAHGPLVAYATVLEKVRHEVMEAADDPDFQRSSTCSWS